MARRGSGEGNVRRAPSRPGLWEGRATLTLPDGRSVRRSFYGKTRAEATAAMADAIRRAQAGVVVPSGQLTVEAYLTEWLAQKTVGPTADLRETTGRRYRSLLEGYVVPVLGRIKLAQLQPVHVERCMRQALSRGLAPRTANHIRSALRSALSDAERLRLVSGNAAKIAEPRRVNAAVVEPMTPEEAGAILRAVAGTDLEPPVATALWTGLRQGEVLGLRWRDIDAQLTELKVRGTLQRHPGRWAWGPTKTEKSRRTVAIPEPLAPVLRAHRSALSALPLATTGPEGLPTDLAFTDEEGHPIHGTVLTHRFRKALAAAGLAQRRFHDLRHGTATLLLAGGVDIKTVSSILGHSTIAVTANTYAQVLPSLHHDAAARMARLMRTPRGAS